MAQKTNRRDTKFARFKQLDCFVDFDKKVRAGLTAYAIARWLQKDLGKCTDIKFISLERSILDYRNSLPPGAITLAQPQYVERAIEKMERGIDELEELESLYLLQKTRISIDCATEAKINKLFSNTNKEIQLAKDILKDRVEIKMKLGILKEAPRKIDVTGSVTNINGNVEFVDEEAKTKLGVVAYKLMQGLIGAGALEEEEENDIDQDEAIVQGEE